ncbi:MAG: hypothetical protein Tsb0013_11610 [Phycisphaerales bacterium]
MVAQIVRVGLEERDERAVETLLIGDEIGGELTRDLQGVVPRSRCPELAHWSVSRRVPGSKEGVLTLYHR